jgi:hypothetical protein
MTFFSAANVLAARPLEGRAVAPQTFEALTARQNLSTPIRAETRARTPKSVKKPLSSQCGNIGEYEYTIDSPLGAEIPRVSAMESLTSSATPNSAAGRARSNGTYFGWFTHLARKRGDA